MNGEIWLCEDYDSGIPGYPGAQFVLNLNAPPLDLNTEALDRYEETMGGIEERGAAARGRQCLEKLPKKMKVLFVDDDLVLRKLVCSPISMFAVCSNFSPFFSHYIFIFSALLFSLVAP